MAINKVNTTAEEKSFKFLTTQSTILRTADTNNITINGVNVIVDKPKVGDVMCVTKYKNDSGTLLGADKQKVIWIDGLSINPDKLSEELEPVGICMVVNGNKALVKYREENVLKFLARPGTLMELPDSQYMNDGVEHGFIININNSSYNYYFSPNDTANRYSFVRRLNDFFHSYYLNYSADLVELDSEIPVSYIDCDKKDSEGNYYNRIIITSSYYTANFAIDYPDFSYVIKAVHTGPKGVKENELMYRKNGFSGNSYTSTAGCNFAAYYNYCYSYGYNPSTPLTTINTDPVSYEYFDKSSYIGSSYYDSLLHNTFDNYEDYVDSFMIKYPCGAGGIVADDPSGKESTYKLGNSAYTYNAYFDNLYPAAYYATNISVNAPNLGKGNWWIPSVSEMAQMMRDIGTKTNIVNTVLSKLSSCFISYTSYDIFTSSLHRKLYFDSGVNSYTNYIYYYNTNNHGFISTYGINYLNNPEFNVTPITIYEF